MDFVSSPRAQFPRSCLRFRGELSYTETVKELGEGSYGIVTLVQNKDSGLSVARKTLAFAGGKGGVSRNLIDETSMLLNIQLPTVVHLYDMSADKDTVSLYLEYGGESIKDRKFTERDFRPLLYSLVSTVASLASMGIVHGDLKPENILLPYDDSKEIKLIDFGNARQSLPGNIELLGNGGSQVFWSPERQAHTMFDDRSETWAIALIWCEALIGRQIKDVEEARRIFPAKGEARRLFDQMLSVKNRPKPEEIMKDEYFVDLYIDGNVQSVISGYRWHENSCYIDSLLMVMFFSIADKWRNVFFDVDVTEYPPVLECTGGATIDDVNQFRTKVQQQLEADFNELELGETNPKCRQLRQYLVQCEPDTREHGVWVTYNVGNMYSALVRIFPYLNMDIPEVSDLTPPTRRQTARSLCTVSDYMINEFPVLEPGVKATRWIIDWDRYDGDILVLQNEGQPRIRFFDQVGEEHRTIRIPVGQDEKGKMRYREEKSNIFKSKALNYTILQDRYTLVGVVTLEGIGLNSGAGGTHYVAHFLADDGKWYFYNDLKGGNAREVAELPRAGVWEEANNKMPALFFYARTDRLKQPSEEEPTYAPTIFQPRQALDLRSETIRPLDDPTLFEARNATVAVMLGDCQNFDLAWSTYFLAVKLFDLVISIVPSLLTETETDNAGSTSIACISLASKFLEPNYMSTKDLSEYTGLSERHITSREFTILSQLCFNVNYSTAYDYYRQLSAPLSRLPILVTLLRTNQIYVMTDRELAITASRLLTPRIKKLVDTENELSNDVDSQENSPSNVSLRYSLTHLSP